MSNESAYWLHRIDCNCNNCGFMVRDTEKYQYSLALHHIWQRQYFDLLNRKKIEKANEWMDKGDYKKASVLIEEVNKSRFQFNKSEALIQHGHCFIHRKDYLAEK